MAEAVFKDKKIIKFLEKLEKDQKAIQKRERRFVGEFLSPFVFQDIDEHFRKEEGPNGPWDDRKQPYRRKIERQGFTKILQVTGNLRKRTRPIKMGKNWRKHRLGILWFNNAKTKNDFPYAYAHDNDEPGRKTLPRRSFMWLSEKKMKEIEKAFFKHFFGE